MANKRNTAQKEIIYQTLCSTHDHPTTATVYQRVHEKHPTISRSTVYRVLGQMAEEGRILRIPMTDSADRYDGQTFSHSHAHCRVCGAMMDLPPVLVGELPESCGFLPESCAIVYTGICRSCREKEAQ